MTVKLKQKAKQRVLEDWMPRRGHVTGVGDMGLAYGRRPSYLISFVLRHGECLEDVLMMVIE